jgi:putative DNA primase/helicase
LVEKEQPVLIVDEADTFTKNNLELVGVINSGHRRELAYVARCIGDDHVPTKFSTWCPKVLALIGKPSATILDRSIVIRLQRKRPDESTERLNNQAAERLKTIARKLAKAVTDDVRVAMYRSDPAIPAILNDRQADNWRNLLALADLAGGHWPTEARNAATTLALLDSDEPETLALQLIIDALGVFRESNCDRLKPEELADRLAKLPDRPWGTLTRGRAISPNKLAAMLRPYDIQSVKTHGLRVYLRDDFQKVCDRYCPRPPETNCPSVPLEHKCLSDNDLRGDTLKKESDVFKRSVPPQVLDNQGLTASGDTWTVENGSMGENEAAEWVF